MVHKMIRTASARLPPSGAPWGQGTGPDRSAQEAAPAPVVKFFNDQATMGKKYTVHRRSRVCVFESSLFLDEIGQPGCLLGSNRERGLHPSDVGAEIECGEDEAAASLLAWWSFC